MAGCLWERMSLPLGLGLPTFCHLLPSLSPQASAPGPETSRAESPSIWARESIRVLRRPIYRWGKRGPEWSPPRVRRAEELPGEPGFLPLSSGVDAVAARLRTRPHVARLLQTPNVDAGLSLGLS